jgi:site-specific recombinase XerD
MRKLTDMREKSDPSGANLLPGNSTGRPLQAIKKFWKAVTEQAGIADYRLHDNRHTHASHLVSGLSLEIVGRLLGHNNPTTTKRYAHIADSPLNAATETWNEGEMYWIPIDEAVVALSAESSWGPSTESG